MKEWEGTLQYHFGMNKKIDFTSMVAEVSSINPPAKPVGLIVHYRLYTSVYFFLK